jgi:hypothetical protein
MEIMKIESKNSRGEREYGLVKTSDNGEALVEGVCSDAGCRDFEEPKPNVRVEKRKERSVSESSPKEGMRLPAAVI